MPLTKDRWWRVWTVVHARLADAISELMETALRAPAVQCIRPDRWDVTVTVFICQNARPDLTQLRAIGPASGGTASDVPLIWRVAPLRIENWAHSWKRHFRPFEVRRKLLIKPTWSRRQAKPGQVVVELDPGLSFGTGQHPTTAFCLDEIVSFRRPGSPRSFLDVGTGSGILAIAAARLGYRPVHAFDIDPAAIRSSTANARRNHVQHSIKPRVCDLAHFVLKRSLRYDLVCANLTDDLLVAEAPRIVGSLAPAGRLALAGVLRKQFDRVRKVYERLGLKVRRVKSESGWCSATFVSEEA